MNNVSKYISIDPEICHGQPCIKGHRIMVWQILDLLAAGTTPEKIITESFPQLKPEQIYACIDFANQFVKNEEIHFYEESKAK